MKPKEMPPFEGGNIASADRRMGRLNFRRKKKKRGGSAGGGDSPQLRLG